MSTTSEIFRFTLVRPAEPINKNDVIYISAFTEETDFQKNLKKVRGESDGFKKMVEFAKKFIESNKFVKNLEALSIKVGKFGDWIDEKQPSKLIELINGIKDSLGSTPSTIVKKPEFQNDKKNLADSLIALQISSPGMPGDISHLTRAIRLSSLIEITALEDKTLTTKQAIDHVMKRVILLPKDIFPLPPVPAILPPTPKTKEDKEKRKKDLEEKLRNMKGAMGELLSLKSEDFKTVQVPVTSQPKVGEEISPPEGIQEQPDDKKKKAADEKKKASPVSPMPELPQIKSWTISEKGIAKLSSTSKKVIQELGFSFEELVLTEAVEKIEKEMVKVGTELFQLNESEKKVQRLGYNLIKYTPPVEEGKKLYDTSTQKNDSPTSLITPVGVADLLIVRQTIQRCELGEVAHIENVLAGELKERIHRRKHSTEEMWLTETEREEETEKDLQSTERFELQRESEKAIEESLKVEAGVEVTASYGPSVTVKANVGSSYEQTKSESQRTASNYAKDVTQKATSRVQERVREQRMRRMIEEIEETNTHKLENATPDHKIGLYRWIDKIYKAEIVNYGARLMFDFTVPEPGTFALYSMLHKSSLDGTSLEEPEEFSLTPAEVSEANYLILAKRYNVSEVSPPPQTSKEVSFVYKTTNNSLDWSFEAIADKIEIPDGYFLWGLRAIFSSCDTADTADVSKKALVAGNIGDLTVSFKIGGTFEPDLVQTYTYPYKGPYPGPHSLLPVTNKLSVPIALVITHNETVVVSVVGWCMRTDRSYEEWQIKTHAAILQGYLRLKSEYDEKLAASSVAQGVAISGRNPEENRKVERNELQKAAIALLRNKHYDFNSIEIDETAGYPRVNLGTARAEGEIIQFFEHAFEWQNLAYVFYPYFWTRIAQWPVLQQIQDTDPLHAQFLQAGAARVVVPVRPGYEDMVRYYLGHPEFAEERDRIWKGAEPPDVDDEAYYPLWQEIQNMQKIDIHKDDGKISVVKDSAEVTGEGTKFDEDDVDREITIEMQKYRIKTVQNETKLTLTENYPGETRNAIPYFIGLKYIGAPWEVRVPTSLVYLQRDDALPDWTK